ncbi:MAG: threonine synthase [Gammaproteobacteria bacterium AqS3]|nr:threonine synthase [Gammaproteobacteria bacterium AqS3]
MAPDAASRYRSTRGGGEVCDFAQALLNPRPPDGGLYVPEGLPHFGPDELEELHRLSYLQLAERIIAPFIGDALAAGELAGVLARAYRGFEHEEVVRLRALDGGTLHGGPLHLLELFHGPTLAFKDVALQLLGTLLDDILSRQGQRRLILTATSGDTGSAAIEACRNCARLDIAVLFPHERITEFQRRQMTSVQQDNVLCLAVRGDFDDCQNLLKAALGRGEALTGAALMTVNSINWARLMAQVVYYFYAGLRLDQGGGVNFAVPTGNFGNIYAGVLAGRMGLPVRRLLLATNRNDILHRALVGNDYSRVQVQGSVAPSMDISIASNFERLVHFLTDAQTTARLQAEFAESGVLALPDAAWQCARELFASSRWDDDGILQAMQQGQQRYGVVLDPHTAAALAAAQQYGDEHPTAVLATAHPAKFSEALVRAGLGEFTAEADTRLATLRERGERFEVIDPDLDSLQKALGGSSLGGLG